MATNTFENRFSVSVIIPTLNGGESLRELLAGLSIQTVLPDEILVIDSQSNDNTVEVAKIYGAQVLPIERASFDHGTTRSMAARVAKGDILVYFTQDVVPAHRRLLELLISPLLGSDSVAVSYGRQLPAFDADEISAHLRQFNYRDTSCLRTFEDRELLGLETVFISNSCAAYRKQKLAEVNYFKNGLIFGEDTCAAGRLLEKKYKIAYAADALVYHSHNYEWHEEFCRYFDIGVFHTDEAWLLKTYGGAADRGRQYVRSGIAHLYRLGFYGLIGDFVVRVALKFIGYHLGRHYKILPARLVPKMSMNKSYWRSGKGF